MDTQGDSVYLFIMLTNNTVIEICPFLKNRVELNFTYVK